MKTKLAKPTNVHLITGLIISIIQSLTRGYSDADIPEKVGKYLLVQVIKKENLLKGYAVGIYQYKKEKVFIKTWNGDLKNFGYYALVNEFITSKILYKKFQSYNSKTVKGRIKIPEPIKYISTKDSLSLVYEYVDGDTLTTALLKEKVEILAYILKVLWDMSNAITENEKRQLFKRNKIFYIVSLLAFAILTIVSNPKNCKVVLNGLLKCIKTFRLLNESNLCIAHRDLTPHNILVNNKGVYIVDWSRMALTIPNYDITYMSLMPKLKPVADLISQKTNFKPNKFLKNYILIHSAHSFGAPEGYDNFYEKELYRLYAR
ncbi:MAG: phosphotransferase [Candidatus Levybacteria bacterium]|nr:phosphotransferase [Candidatus Levybacteria bacterium]